ncbi:MAG: DUF2164 family protein [Dehalococcoidia bacterium]|nr:DUF2164 family protein [Dehalococcoidia bacterium]
MGPGLTKDEQEWAIRRLCDYFERERGDELNELGAALLLDFLTEQLGPLYYNRAIRDAQALAQRASVGLEEDLEVAKQILPGREEGQR